MKSKGREHRQAHRAHQDRSPWPQHTGSSPSNSVWTRMA